MIRSELIARLALERPWLTKEEIVQVIDVFFEEVARKLSDGGRVELRGFGTFSMRHRAPRIGRNPRSGEAVDVPALRALHFKSSKLIQQRLNPGESGISRAAIRKQQRQNAET